MYISFHGQHAHIAQAPKGVFFLLNKLTSNNGWNFTMNVFTF
jgi:hypothetical protein